MYINWNLIIINQYTAVLVSRSGPGPDLDRTPGPGPVQVQVQVRGPQKVPGPDLDRTLDSPSLTAKVKKGWKRK